MPEPTGNREVIFTLGLNTQGWDGHEDGTTHYYQFVESDSAINWTDARTAASNSTFFGQPGYLATITSFVETVSLLIDLMMVVDRLLDGSVALMHPTFQIQTGFGLTDPRRAALWVNDGSGGQYITGSGLDGQTNNVNQTCAEQTVAWNGSTHESDSWFSGGNWRDDRWRRCMDTQKHWIAMVGRWVIGDSPTGLVSIAVLALSQTAAIPKIICK